MAGKFIVGCGYLGIRVARLWQAHGAKVHSLTRSAERAAGLAAEGLLPVVGDVLSPADWPELPQVETVLFAVGYDRQSGQSIEAVYVDGLRKTLQALGEPAGRRLIYISSTGVYAQDGDEWVNEESECRPTRAGGLAHLAAERLLAESAWASHSIVLRLAGLYGPDRVPRQRELLEGRPMAVAQQAYLNLIHVDDAAQIVLAAERSERCPRLYLVADGHPVRRGDYLSEIAQLLGAPPPKFIEPVADHPPSRHSAGSKRVDSGRLREELTISWQHPSYRHGLRAILGG